LVTLPEILPPILPSILAYDSTPAKSDTSECQQRRHVIKHPRTVGIYTAGYISLNHNTYDSELLPSS
jgi:hypothetical protein